jgi:hypothetical protein
MSVVVAVRDLEDVCNRLGELGHQPHKIPRNIPGELPPGGLPFADRFSRLDDGRMKIATFAFAAQLTGCQVSSPVTPAGRDTYMVSAHVGACVSCSAQVKSMRTANEFCKGSSRSGFSAAPQARTAGQFADLGV